MPPSPREMGKGYRERNLLVISHDMKSLNVTAIYAEQTLVIVKNHLYALPSSPSKLSSHDVGFGCA